MWWIENSEGLYWCNEDTSLLASWTDVFQMRTTFTTREYLQLRDNLPPGGEWKAWPAYMPLPGHMWTSDE
jgi:hypothetical protein